MKYAYIIKGGYYYRPGSKGYTDRAYEAGVYTMEEALNHQESTHGDAKVIEIDIDKHNTMLRMKIHEMEQNMINAENVTLRLKPFTALTLHGITEMVKGRLKNIPSCERIVEALDDYETELIP